MNPAGDCINNNIATHNYNIMNNSVRINCSHLRSIIRIWRVEESKI
jgi:hypothetical protein